MKYIDFHVHIDHYPDPIKTANEYESYKIYALFVTNLPELFEKQYSSFKNYKYVRLALGFHPTLVGDYHFNANLFDSLINLTHYIGEVGIDQSKQNKHLLKQQSEIFDYVTQPRFNLGKIYSIHSAGAEDEVLEILINNQVKHAVFHWYSGKLTTLERIIDRGYLFSINHRMLTSKKGQKIINMIPKELLLFETDGPFARYNKKIVQPEVLPEIYAKFNDCIEGFDQIAFKNFRRILLERDLLKAKIQID